jgi:thioredoxin-related protein
MKTPFLIALLGLALVSSARAELNWSTDLSAAKAQAAKESKKLLLDFTGSDWCVYCKKLDAEVFTTPEFATFAKDYVLVRVDYPRGKELPAAEKEQNAVLKAKYKIQGYPTVIVVDDTGHELRRAEGYDPGSGPTAFLGQFSESQKH